MNSCIDCGKRISEKAKRCRKCNMSSSEYKLKHSAGLERTREKRIKGLKEMYKNKSRLRQINVDVSYIKKEPIAREKGRYIVKNKGKYYSSELENKIIGIINELNIKCKQGYMPIEINYVFDGYLPSYNTLIEVDGEYWHKKARAKKLDAKKSALAKAAGYKLIRFKEEKLPNSKSKLIGYVARRLTRGGIKMKLTNQILAGSRD